MNTGLFKNVDKCLYKSYIFNIYVKLNLILNNLQWFIYHKSQPNQSMRVDYSNLGFNQSSMLLIWNKFILMWSALQEACFQREDAKITHVLLAFSFRCISVVIQSTQSLLFLDDWAGAAWRLRLHGTELFCAVQTSCQENTKIAMCSFEKVLEATPYKTAAVQPLTSHPNRTNKTCWISKNKLISDILLWSHTYGHINVSWPAKNLQSSSLGRHWMPSREVGQRDVW